MDIEAFPSLELATSHAEGAVARFKFTLGNLVLGIMLLPVTLSADAAYVALGSAHAGFGISEAWKTQIELPEWALSTRILLFGKLHDEAIRSMQLFAFRMVGAEIDIDMPGPTTHPDRRDRDYGSGPFVLSEPLEPAKAPYTTTGTVRVNCASLSRLENGRASAFEENLELSFLDVPQLMRETELAGEDPAGVSRRRRALCSRYAAMALKQEALVLYLGFDRPGNGAHAAFVRDMIWEMAQTIPMIDAEQDEVDGAARICLKRLVVVASDVGRDMARRRKFDLLAELDPDTLFQTATIPQLSAHSELLSATRALLRNLGTYWPSEEEISLTTIPTDLLGDFARTTINRDPLEPRWALLRQRDFQAEDTCNLEDSLRKLWRPFLLAEPIGIAAAQAPSRHAMHLEDSDWSLIERGARAA